MDAETQEIRQARQRASVKWLISKAFNNRVPDNLKEPFYCDQENQLRLKPQIIVELGNGSLYCQALSNLYSDPNYQSLNHWSLLQTLTRKGVPVIESPELPITETVLIQTNPLRINAHMSVIESLMILYAKEICSHERIKNAIQRISGKNYQPSERQTFEHTLLLWISNVCVGLKNKIVKETEINNMHDNDKYLKIPEIPAVNDFQDLCDGVSLAFLICYYCPKALSWTDVRVNYLPAVEDCIHNILLVCDFSQKFLPYNIFHMTPEDVTFMRGSMKLNLIVLLADFFNLFEIHPAKCVCYPDMEDQEVIDKRNINTNEHGICYRRGLTMQTVTPIPDLRSETASSCGSPTRPNFQVTYTHSPKLKSRDPAHVIKSQDMRNNDAFVVHKSRGITTLSSVHSQHPETLPYRHFKDKINEETRDEEKGEHVPAGRPSNWDQNRRISFSGRRSRRNSSSEDSQLTIENFGGSHEQLNLVGRYDRDIERPLFNTSAEPAVAVRSSIADARGSLQLSYDLDSNSEKEDNDTEKHLNQANAILEQKEHSLEKDFDKEQNSFSVKNSVNEIDEIKEQPTESGHLIYKPTCQSNYNDSIVDNTRSADVSKLANIRMKLEEKQRNIEKEKKRIELALLRYQEMNELENLVTQNSDAKSNQEMDSADLEKFHQSIAIMNMNLQDIQQDIQRLTTSQSQLQAQHLQAQQLMQAQQIANMLNQQQFYGSQQHLADQLQQRPIQKKQIFGSSPHLSQSYNVSRPPSRDPYQQHMPVMPLTYSNEHAQYVSSHQKIIQRPHYVQKLYDDNTVNPYGNSNVSHQIHPRQQQQQQQYINQNVAYDDYPQSLQMRENYGPLPGNHYYPRDTSSPASVHRRTWTNSGYDQQLSMMDLNLWESQKQVANVESWGYRPSHPSHNHSDSNDYQYVYEMQSTPPSRASEDNIPHNQSFHSFQGNKSLSYMQKMSQNPVPDLLPDEMMTPQSICFIGDEEDVEDLERNIIESMHAAHITDFAHKHLDAGRNSRECDNNELLPHKLKVASGNLTYRIPSPSRPTVAENNFQDPRDQSVNEKGFYISFDDKQPKRPKPPLRIKRSPKNDRNLDKDNGEMNSQHDTTDAYISSTVNSSNNEFHKSDITMEVKPWSGGEVPSKNATYNKYSDRCINLSHLLPDERPNDGLDRQETFTTESKQEFKNKKNNSQNTFKGKALLIGSDITNLDPNSVEEMERRKEKILLLSLQRRNQQEEAKAQKEIEATRKREREREKEEERSRKKEEQMARRAAILEQHRLKKALEEAEREGKPFDRTDMNSKQQTLPTSGLRLRQQRTTRPRPKTIHVDDGSIDVSETSSISSRSKKGSSTNLTANGHLSSNSRRDYYKGSHESLSVKESPDDFPSTSSTPVGRKGSHKASKESQIELGRSLSRISVAKGSSFQFRGRKSNSLSNLCDTDSGLGRATPPRRAPSPGVTILSRHVPSPSGPGSLPHGLMSKRRTLEDAPGDNLLIDYSGPKLYKQPTAKSNRGIILNAVEYCVFPGAVNRESKQKVLEKIARSEAKHFLILFRDAGCQFRALYSYIPETDQICKLYGTGPSQVDEVMFDKFFKYNSGGKCFSQVHTKHLTVTIDAFTIHNSLWQGKKVQLPSKKDMVLVI